MRTGVRFFEKQPFPFSPQPVAVVLSLVLLSACNPTINDRKGEEYVAAVNAKKGAGAFSDLTGSIANSQFSDGVVTAGKIDPGYTSTLATKTYADSYMLGYALPAVSTFGSGQTIRWNTTTSSWEVFTPAAAAIAAGSITTTEIADGTIAAADLAADAVTSAKILNDEIVNADINTAAAIAGTKISPNFGAQNILTTGTLAVGATTLSGALALGTNNISTTGTISAGAATFTSLSLSGTQTANTVYAGPASGVPAAPAFRALVAADMPAFTGGDVTTSAGSVVTTVATVGTSTAANVHAAELLANAATNANTASTIVKRDASGNFSVGTISAGGVSVSGTLSVASTGTLSVAASPGILPRGYIDGLVLSSPGSSATLTIAAGTARSDDNTMDLTLSSVWTKTVTTAWAAGTAAGVLDAGTFTGSAWYHVFLIGNPTTLATDVLISTSTSPTMPSGAWTKKRRIGSIREDGSGTILGFYQNGERFLWKDIQVPQTNLIVPTTAENLYDVGVPTGFVVKAIGVLNPGLGGSGVSGAGSLAVAITSPNVNSQLPSSEAIYPTFRGIAGGMWWSSGVYDSTASYFEVFTDTSAQVRLRRAGNYYDNTNTGIGTSVQIWGWEDRRGRDQ